MDAFVDTTIESVLSRQSSNICSCSISALAGFVISFENDHIRRNGGDLGA